MVGGMRSLRRSGLRAGNATHALYKRQVYDGLCAAQSLFFLLASVLHAASSVRRSNCSVSLYEPHHSSIRPLHTFLHRCFTLSRLELVSLR